MTDIALIAPRLAALLPLLGSSHDGEIVATARAIDRTLASVGADLHDLTATFQAGARALPQQQQKARPRTARWSDMGLREQAEALGFLSGAPWLSEWEADFVESVSRHHQTHGLSAKQISVVERLLVRALKESRS